jgi:hypothetical protein
MVNVWKNRVAVLSVLTIGAALLVASCLGKRRGIDERIVDHLEAARAAVRAEVAEPERELVLLQHLDALEVLLREQRESHAALTTRLQALNADPATTTARLQTELDSFIAERNARRARALDLHEAMRDATRPEEWEAIVEAEVQALSLGASAEGS